MSKPIAYVINLARRPERLLQMQTLWSPFFELVRFPAVDMPGAGADGCKRSHIAIAEKVLAENDMVIVLEDDAVPTRVAREEVVKFILEAARCVPHWDYINCGPCIDPGLTGRKDITLTPGLSKLFLKTNFSYRTHFVLYNRNSLPILRASMDTKTEIDVWLGMKAKNHWVPIHVLAVQSEGVSDIRKPGKEHIHGYQTSDQMLQTAVPRPCFAAYVNSDAALEKFVGVKLPKVLFTDAGVEGVTPMRSPLPGESPTRENAMFLVAAILAKRGGFTHMIYGVDHADAVWDAYCVNGRYNAFTGQDIIVDGHVVPIETADALLKFSEGGTLDKARTGLPVTSEIGSLLYRQHGAKLRNYIVHIENWQVPDKTFKRVAEPADASDGIATRRPGAPSQGDTGSIPVALTISDASQYLTLPVEPKALIVADGEPKNSSEADASDPLPEAVLRLLA